MAANGQEAVRRYEVGKAVRANHDDRWELLRPFINPSVGSITSEDSPGTKQTQGVFDSTGIFANEICGQFLSSNLISPAQDWIGGLRMDEEEFNDVDEVREYLDECNFLMLKRMAESSFYADAPVTLGDTVGFGTGSLLIEELPVNDIYGHKGFRGLYYKADRIGRYVIEEGANGLVDAIFREYTMTARAIQDRWGKDRTANGLPESVRTALDGGKPETEFKIIHGIYPRPNGERSYGAKAMPYVSCWVEKGTKEVIKEGGYSSFPCAVPRYSQTPGEIYGRGRGDIAYDDIRTLNKLKEMAFKDWALKAQPPILTSHDSVIGTLSLVPGAHTPIRTGGRPIRDVFQPYDSGSRPEVTQLAEDELRKSINKIFFVEHILSLMEQPKVEQTAYEVSKRFEILYGLMGPVYGKMQRQFLKPIVDRTFEVMQEGREFPPPPPILQASNGVSKAMFRNPLANAQRAREVEGINMAMQDKAALAQVHPEIWDRWDPDKYSDLIDEIRGVPAKVRRNEEEVAKVRADRQAQQEQLANMEATKVTADAIGKVGPGLAALQGNGSK